MEKAITSPCLRVKRKGEALGVLRNVRSDYGKEIRKEYEAGNIKISRHDFIEKEIREDGISNTLDSVQKDNLVAVKIGEPVGIIDPQGRTNKAVEPSDAAPTPRAQTHGNQPEVVLPVFTPDRIEKRQNGRRFKENGDEAFTLTAQDRHGVAIKVAEATKKDMQKRIRAIQSTYPCRVQKQDVGEWEKG